MLDNARYLHSGLSELGFQVVEPTRLADGTEIVTPVVPGRRGRRLEGRLPVEGAVRRGRVRQRGPASRPSRRPARCCARA